MNLIRVKRLHSISSRSPYPFNGLIKMLFCHIITNNISFINYGRFHFKGFQNSVNFFSYSKQIYISNILIYFTFPNLRYNEILGFRFSTRKDIPKLIPYTKKAPNLFQCSNPNLSTILL